MNLNLIKNILVVFLLFFGLVLGHTQVNALGYRDLSSLPKRQEFAYLSGRIITFNPPVLVIQTKEKKIPLRIGPRWYWSRQAYQLQPGQKVKVYGYNLNDYFVPVEILSQNQRIQLRDEQGFPLWRRSELFNSGRARGDYSGDRRGGCAGRGGNRGGGGNNRGGGGGERGDGNHGGGSGGGRGGGNHGGESGGRGGGNHGGESGGRGGGNHGGESGGRGGGGRR